MSRRTLACMAVLLAGACSDGTQPELPAAGAFSATLSGVRSGQLGGAANAGFAGTELGDQYAIRMFATPSNGKVSFLTLICDGGSRISVGSYPFGPGQPCEGRYGLATSDSLSVLEHSVAESGSMTVTLSNAGELDGSFRFHGSLVQGTDTVGVLSATGSFRAVAL